MSGSLPTFTIAIRVTCLSEGGSRAGEKMEGVGAQDDIGEAPDGIGRGSCQEHSCKVGACPRPRGGDELRRLALFSGLDDVHVSYAAVNNTISMPPLLRLMEYRLNQVIGDSRQVIQ